MFQEAKEKKEIVVNGHPLTTIFLADFGSNNSFFLDNFWQF